MPLYKWEARTSGGHTVRGELEAPSRDSVEQNLSSQRLTVSRIDEVAGTTKTGGADPVPSPGGRHGRGFFRRNLLLVGVLGVFTSLSIGLAFLDPVHFYDCARQPNGGVDCTVRRRVWGLVPRADVAVPGVVSVDVKSRQRSKRQPSGGTRRRSTYSTLVLTRADGTRWQSPESSWPTGRTPEEHADGIRSLLEGREQTYRGFTAENVTLLVSAAFLVPLALFLLGLVLRSLLSR